MNGKVFINYTRVREALDFPRVLEHYNIDFDTSKNQVKIGCPFHDDKTPSCSVNLSGNKFQCFGCGTKGNALEFVVLMEDGDPSDKDDLYAGALTAIEIMGLSPEDFKRGAKSPRKPREASNKEKTAPASQSASKPRKSRKSGQKEDKKADAKEKENPVLDLNLKLDQEHPFLKGRGLDKETIQTFGLGFCNRGLMKNRIAIPIHNKYGELVAYAGRWADEEIPDGTMRYKLPGNFHKSLELYNLHRAKKLGRRHLVVVEGFWSTFRLHMAGIPVVALMGRSASEEQAKLIADSGFRFVTLLLDGDAEGRNAIPEAIDVLGRKVYVRALELPEGVKPDTMSEEMLESLR